MLQLRLNCVATKPCLHFKQALFAISLNCFLTEKSFLKNSCNLHLFLDFSLQLAGNEHDIKGVDWV